MAHKKKHSGPVPSGNKSSFGAPGVADPQDHLAGRESGAHQETDPKRRLGDYAERAKHPIQQPTPLNDGQQHSR